MSDIIVLTVGAMICMALISVVSYKSTCVQQRTIDRLADRLMARDYKEYSSMQPKPATPEKQRRAPLSWYDEPDIEEDVHM